MSNILPYNFDSHSVHASPSVSSSHGFTSGSHASSNPAALVFRRPESSSPSLRSSPSSSCLFTPSLPSHHSLTVAEWAGTKRGSNTCSSNVPSAPAPESGDWRDVHNNIKRMDHLYDATFYSWLKSEDNVLVTAMYLHRIANEYDLERIANALKWLVQDWRWESTSILVRHVTVDWCDDEGDRNRAYLLRHLTQNWATQYTATLITTILATPPYLSSDNAQRERFLRAFAQNWDFSKLSEFFMYLQSRANVDYKFKCIMLQEAAQRERETLSAKLHSRMKRAELKSRQEISSSVLSSSSSSATHSHHSNNTNHMDLDPPQPPPCATADHHHDEPIETEHNPSEPIFDLVAHATHFTPTATDIVAPSTEESTADETRAASSTALGSSSASTSSSGATWRHHRRTSSNDATDMNKRFRLSRTDIETEESENAASSSLADISCLSATTSMSLDTPPQASSTLTATTTTTTSNTTTTTTTISAAMTRRAATPDHACHHHHILCSSSPSAAPAQPTTAQSVTGSSSIAAGVNATNNNSSSSNGTPLAPTTMEYYHHHHYHHHHHQTGDAGGIGSDLSHLHLGFAGGGDGSSSMTTAAAASSPTNTFPSSRHACYQNPPPSSSAPSSHLQVHHNFHLRRRSSSSSSTTSTGSVGSSHLTTTATGASGASSSSSSTTTMEHLDEDSGIKKRSTTSVSNQETPQHSSVYR